MQVTLFSSKPYDRDSFSALCPPGWQLNFLDARLDASTAALAAGSAVVCAFVNDDLSAPVLQRLQAAGCQLIALRSAGFNHVDLNAAARLGLPVVRVPAYSPHAVAEHAVALMLTLNRRIHKAYQRTRDANFSLDGLIGFNMYGKTAGVVGTGRIGLATARILKGFGCQLLAYDPYPSKAAEEIGASYVDLDTLLGQSDIVTLHCPLTPENTYLINSQSLAKMKPGALLINTGRGGLVDELALEKALDAGQISGAGFDVTDGEPPAADSPMMRIASRENVILTPHVAWASREAIQALADQLIENIELFLAGKPRNLVG